MKTNSHKGGSFWEALLGAFMQSPVTFIFGFLVLGALAVGCFLS